jgi:hypothetical protein
MTEEQPVPAAVPIAWPNQDTSSLDRSESAPFRATTLNASQRSSARTAGRRGLSLVRESLSDRDWTVLTGVARHRYLTTRQIEGFWFADHATPLTGARVCRRVLRHLADLHVLVPSERRIGGVRAGSASYVWQIGPVGDRLLRTDTDNPRTRQREPGGQFLAHCLAVADLHLALVRAHRANELELVSVQTEPECWRRYSGLGGARLVLQPDLYAETGDPADPAFVNCWFCEVDRGTEHVGRLLAKCHRYEAYRRIGREQAETGGFPLVVWVMHTAQRVECLQAAIQRETTLDAALYRITMPEQFASLIREGVA